MSGSWDVQNGGDTAHGNPIDPAELSLAEKIIERFVARAIRLYEQEPGEAFAFARLGLYVRRWVRWARSGGAD